MLVAAAGSAEGRHRRHDDFYGPVINEAQLTSMLAAIERAQRGGRGGADRRARG